MRCPQGWLCLITIISVYLRKGSMQKDIFGGVLRRVTADINV